MRFSSSDHEGRALPRTRIAIDRAPGVTNAESVEQALAVMRAKGARTSS